MEVQWKCSERQGGVQSFSGGVRKVEWSHPNFRWCRFVFFVFGWLELVLVSLGWILEFLVGSAWFKWKCSGSVMAVQW